MSFVSRRLGTAMALAAFLLLAATLPAGATTFISHTISDTADGSNMVYAVDLDGDSDMDVISASSNDDKIAWYENDGNENFTAHTISILADGARSVYALDLDGDLDIDVISASFNDNKIAWYENDGSENFTPHTITTATLGARSVFALDVDGDGDVDALSASYSDNKIAWYENDGSENFTAHSISTAASGAYSVHAMDVDGDLDTDVISASFDGNSIDWYENDGNENFTAHNITTAAVGATSVYAADVDGDSDTDLLSTSLGDNRVVWYENDGSENFTDHIISTTTNGPQSVYAVDVDGDLDLDAVSASSYDHRIAWYENDGSENFTQHTITTVAGGANSVYAADVDGDSHIDLLSSSFSDDKVVWYENDVGTPTTLAMHPTGDGSISEFTTSGCADVWDCANDQAGNGGTGPPETYDASTYLDGSTGQRVMFSLDDGSVPEGSTITGITVRAQVHRGGGSGASVRLSYQRVPGASTPDATPVNGPSFDLTTDCCTEISSTWSDGNWTTDDLDNLEIGLIHNSGGSAGYITQMYVFVEYVPGGASLDSDGDSLWDHQEDLNADADGDPATNPAPDTDGDTFPNYLDSDDDGDGTPTASENADPNADGDPRDAVDSDRDGQPDYLDAPTSASNGTVGSEQKISDLVGGLTADLIDGDYFGKSVAGIGDVDGDGIVDVAVGAWRDDGGGGDRGAVYVLFLNADGTVKAEQKISDIVGGLNAVIDNGDWFGASVAGIGDIDGDGIGDMAVGASGDDDGGSGRGAVYVLFLNADGTVKAEQKISDLAGGLAAVFWDIDYFGYAVAGVGDVDGDGIGDMAVGVWGDDDGGSARGAVHVLFLNADGTVKAEQKISDLAGGLTGVLSNGDYFGYSVAGIGDVDGDGTNDMAVGAGGDDSGGTDRGAVYVLFLNADGTVKTEQKISDLSGGLTGVLGDNDSFGASAAGIGDVNGDGIGDLVIGAYGDDDGGSGRGAVHVLFLNTDGTVKAEQKISHLAGGLTEVLSNGDQFGYSVAGIGDVSDDGAIDLLVGTYADDDGGSDRGAVYVLQLGSNASPIDLTATPVIHDAESNSIVTIGSQTGPQETTATLTSGRTVTVYTAGLVIYADIFDADSNLLSNTRVIGNGDPDIDEGLSPVVAARPDGGFVVVSEVIGYVESGNFGHVVIAHFYDAGGNYVTANPEISATNQMGVLVSQNTGDASSRFQVNPTVDVVGGVISVSWNNTSTGTLEERSFQVLGPFVLEDATAGTVVADLTSIDPNPGDTFTYSIVGGDSNFETVGSELRVMAGSALDYETATSHSIVLRCMDAGGLIYDETITIMVGDVPEGGINISGTVFEDVNYGGGSGRDYATSLAQAGPFTIERNNVTLELYDAVGAFHSSATTALDGSFGFTGLTPAFYTVRAVSGTVTSARAGSNGTEILLQTFRIDGDGEGLGAGANKVGGESPSGEDADVNSGAQTLASLQGTDVDLDGISEWTQSIVTVDASNGNVSGVDFGFNADTIVNTNDSEQGSLRQFILNTNLLTDQANLNQVSLTAGRETSIFMIPSSADPLGRPVDSGFDSGRGVAVIVPVSELEGLVDSGTFLDGQTQTDNVGDTNAGTLGYIGPVGLGIDGVIATGDESALSGVAAPEIELHGNSTIEFGLRLQGNDITLRGMAVYGFGIDGLDANILVGHHSLVTDNTNCRIEANVLGTMANTFVDPGPGIRSPAINIYVRTADQGTIVGNLLGFVGRENVRILSTALDWQVIGNEIRAGARETVFGGVTYIADATGELKRNLIADDNATAVLGINTDLEIVDNTIIGNQEGAIAFWDNAGSRITTASVSQNDMTGNGSGVVVLGENGASPAITGIRISRNRFGGNAHNAIDLAPSWTADGISVNDGTLLGDSSVPNSCGSVSTTGNIGLDTPLIDSAILTAGITTISGRACPGVEIEIYQAIADGDASDSAGGTEYGEGIEFLKTTTADGAGDWTIATSALAIGDHVSAVAIDASGNTSEFGPNLAVSEFVLSGIVFEDVDFAGMAQDYDGGVADFPLVNVDVELYDGTTDTLLASTTTTSGGIYGFGALADGTYKIRVRSATIGDADTPPAAGFNPTVPGTWPYPLPEMIWGHSSALIGGQDPNVDDTATGDNAGPGDTYLTVSVSGADLSGVNFGFNYELIVNGDDDPNPDNLRSKQGTLRQFIKNANAIMGVNKSWFQISGL